VKSGEDRPVVIELLKILRDLRDVAAVDVDPNSRQKAAEWVRAIEVAIAVLRDE
jgi:hypothetical protein